MKIGIITLPLHTNYGGILQAYALQTILERMGHVVEYIEVKKDKYLLPLSVRYLVYLKRLLVNIFFKKKNRIFLESYCYENKKIIEKNTRRFINKYIHQNIIKDYSELSEDDYDILMIGSDQIWRSSRVRNNNDYSQFLDFAYKWKIKKITYACSFGEDDWEYSKKETEKIRTLVMAFDAISVREESAVLLCKENLGVDMKLVLDPTLLLDKSDYLNLIHNNISQNNNKLVCYILDKNDDIDWLIRYIARRTNSVPYNVNSRAEDVMAPVEERIQPPVEDWLQAIHEAKVVVTDSFHACVFSIIFNKPFICIGNKKRGMSRFDTLLSTMGMKERMLTDFEYIDDKLFEVPNVNYHDLKKQSLNYLLENI